MKVFCPTCSISIILFFVLGPVEQAFALQTHGGPEGLYAHQLAHLFFIVGMGSFAYRIHRSWLPKQHGWKYFVIGGMLFMAWNLWAFTGHFITLLVPEKNFILPEGRLVPLLHITSWKERLYYVLSMDHLLCVPALICFYFGLRRILTMLSRRSIKDNEQV